jgi:hypothetical protein
MQLQLHAHTSHTSHASHTCRTYTALILVPSFAFSQFAAHGHTDTATATPAAIRTFVVRFCDILGRRCLSCLHVARCPSHTCPCAYRLWCAASFLLPPVAWAAWAAVLMKSSARARARTSSGNFHNFMVGNLRFTLLLRRAVDAGMFFARGSIPPPTHGIVCRTTTPRMVSMIFCPRTSRRSTTTLRRQATPRFPPLTPGCPVVAANHHPGQHHHCMTFPPSLLPLRLVLTVRAFRSCLQPWSSSSQTTALITAPSQRMIPAAMPPPRCFYAAYRRTLTANRCRWLPASTLAFTRTHTHVAFFHRLASRVCGAAAAAWCCRTMPSATLQAAAVPTHRPAFAPCSTASCATTRRRRSCSPAALSCAPCVTRAPCMRRRRASATGAASCLAPVSRFLARA